MSNTLPLKTGQLFQVGRELYQVSEIYDGYLTAQQLYPLQERTTVRPVDKYIYTVVAKKPSKAIIAKYEQAWGFEKGSTH